MDTLSGFWNEVVTVWRAGVGGVDLGHVLTALAVFILFLLLRRFLARILIDFLRRFTKRTRTEIDDAVLTALDGQSPDIAQGVDTGGGVCDKCEPVGICSDEFGGAQPGIVQKIGHLEGKELNRVGLHSVPQPTLLGKHLHRGRAE